MGIGPLEEVEAGGMAECLPDVVFGSYFLALLGALVVFSVEPAAEVWTGSLV